MVALLVIDMQAGSFEPGERPDADQVIERINELARAVREVGGSVIFVQHDGRPGEPLAPGSPEWRLLDSLDRQQQDPVVHKTACDAFYESDLDQVLRRLEETELWVAGSATDFCVDTTIRVAASRDYSVVAVADGHTTSDRPYLDARTIVEHHNAVWRDLILPRSQVQVVETSALVERLSARP